VRSAKDFLGATVTRLAVDHLRSARVRREVYVGPWLPEPLVGVDDVFAAGDAARAMADAGHVAPMSCQFAMPMGDRAGRNAMAELAGRGPSAFRPPPYVTCIDLGEWGGLFTQGWDRQVHLAGFWGKKMKETINTRMIYPPAAVDPGAITTRSRVARPAA
jgi:NADH dehydrogenase